MWLKFIIKLLNAISIPASLDHTPNQMQLVPTKKKTQNKQTYQNMY